MHTTSTIFKQVISTTTNPSDIFANLANAITEFGIPVDIKKVGKTEAKYIHISKSAIENSGKFNSTQFGTSHSERYYFIEKNNQLCIISSETGGGYINRGVSAYHANFDVAYGDRTILGDVFKSGGLHKQTSLNIDSVNTLLDGIRTIYGVNIADRDSIYDLSVKELTSFLKSAFTTDRGKQRVVLCGSRIHYGATQTLITDHQLLEAFILKFKHTVKSLKKISYEELGNLLLEKFSNQISITFSQRDETEYFGFDGKSIRAVIDDALIDTSKTITTPYICGFDKIEFSGELLENVWKNTQFNFTQHYIYNFDFDGSNLPIQYIQRDGLTPDNILFVLPFSREVENFNSTINSISNTICSSKVLDELSLNQLKTTLNHLQGLKKSQLTTLIQPVETDMKSYFENLGYGVVTEICEDFTTLKMTFIATP